MLTVTDVVSTSSIMHKMKTNALSLTIIAIVSALAVGLLSLSYISYYNAAETARDTSPDDYIFIKEDKAKQFKEELKNEGIPYKVHDFHVTFYKLDDSKVFKARNDMEGQQSNSRMLLQKLQILKI